MSDNASLYEIEINKKYVLKIEREMSRYEIEKFRGLINAWLSNDNLPILIVDNNIKLVKIDSENDDD